MLAWYCCWLLIHLPACPTHAFPLLPACSVSLSHSCRAARQAGRRWFAAVTVDAKQLSDAGALAEWLRSHTGARIATNGCVGKTLRQLSGHIAC